MALRSLATRAVSVSTCLVYGRRTPAPRGREIRDVGALGAGRVRGRMRSRERGLPGAVSRLFPGDDTPSIGSGPAPLGTTHAPTANRGAHGLRRHPRFTSRLCAQPLNQGVCRDSLRSAQRGGNSSWTWFRRSPSANSALTTVGRSPFALSLCDPAARAALVLRSSCERIGSRSRASNPIEATSDDTVATVVQLGVILQRTRVPFMARGRSASRLSTRVTVLAEALDEALLSTGGGFVNVSYRLARGSSPRFVLLGLSLIGSRPSVARVQRVSPGVGVRGGRLTGMTVAAIGLRRPRRGLEVCGSAQFHDVRRQSDTLRPRGIGTLREVRSAKSTFEMRPHMRLKA